MIGFVNRYALIAGRSCCAGRSWVSLDRSLARRAGDAPPRSCEPPSLDVSPDPDEVTVAAASAPEPEPAPVAGP